MHHGFKSSLFRTKSTVFTFPLGYSHPIPTLKLPWVDTSFPVAASVVMLQVAVGSPIVDYMRYWNDFQGTRGWVDFKQFIIYENQQQHGLESLLGPTRSTSDIEKKIKERWMTENQLKAAREDAMDGRGFSEARRTHEPSWPDLPSSSRTAISSSFLSSSPTSSSARTALSKPSPAIADPWWVHYLHDDKIARSKRPKKFCALNKAEIAGIRIDESLKDHFVLNDILGDTNLDPYRHLIDASFCDAPTGDALRKRTRADVEEENANELNKIRDQFAKRQRKMEAKQARKMEMLKLRHEVDLAQSKLEEAQERLREFEFGSDRFMDDSEESEDGE